jgi:hypothetical protein
MNLNYKYKNILLFYFYILRAFGLVVYEMIKLDIFFNGTNFFEIAKKIINFENTDLDLNEMKPIYQNILKRYFHIFILYIIVCYCLKNKRSIAKNPNERCSAKELIHIMEV